MTRNGTARQVAMARRHFTVEGLGSLIQPRFGCGEKGDIVFRRRQDVARVIGAKPTSRSNLPIFGSSQSSWGKRGYTICVRVGRMVSFKLGKALRLPASEYCHGASP
jgi:hypothetical protein